MTRRDLIKQALAHKNEGRVPYTIILAPESIQPYAPKLVERYADATVKKEYEAGRINLWEAYSLAIGNCMLYVNAPWWGWHSFPEDYSAEEAPTELPYTYGYGSYENSFAHWKYLRETFDRYLLVTIWGSHFEKAYFARGLENFLADIAGEPEFAARLLNMIIRKNMVMLENFLVSQDIDGVLLGSDWGTQRGLLMSPASWTNLIREGERMEYELVHRMKKDVFVHSCGKIDAILPDLCEIGVDALNPVQPECMDLAELKEKYGEKLTYFGGISTQRTLPNGTPDEVRRETRRVIELMSKDGGYITAPSQEIMPDVPFENLIALIDTAKEYGE